MIVQIGVGVLQLGRISLAFAALRFTVKKFTRNAFRSERTHRILAHEPSLNKQTLLILKPVQPIRFQLKAYLIVLFNKLFYLNRDAVFYVNQFAEWFCFTSTIRAAVQNTFELSARD